MKYEIISRKSNKAVEVEFDEKGTLKVIRFDGSADEDGVNWMLNNIPRKEYEVKGWMPGAFEISVIVENICFADFWDLYDHKVGKVAAEKQWSKLSLSDRAKAVRMLPRYQSYCKQLNPPRRLKDPERYLSQQTFNDTFKIS